MSVNIKNNRKKPLLLCILDGFGIGNGSSSSANAIIIAKTPNYEQILSNYPHCQLGASGHDVGLPTGQVGNSEVGHVSIGSGRIIKQDLPRINHAIADHRLADNALLQKIITNCRKSGGVCHLIGLLSDGGVHSHQDHIIALANIIAAHDVTVKIHAFLDGRDTAQKSAVGYIQYFIDHTKKYDKLIKIVTIGGRYYGMDRDYHWDRIKLAYDAIINAVGKRDTDLIEVVKTSYAQDITDEFIMPTIIGNYQGVKDGDALLIANFRADRICQISTAIVDPEFKEFAVKKINFAAKVKMTKYSDRLSKYINTLFLATTVKNSLGEVLQNENLTQLRIAETEKYAHVTFFFSGGKEKEFKGERRILIQSPPVATYDLKPEMSAKKVGDKLQEAISSNNYDFIVVNYANTDMVGHSGVLDAAVIACQTIDQQLANLRDIILAVDGIMIITADHGNVEVMIDQDNHPHTSHTTNPVPFILIGNDVKNIQLKNGKLSDIAPTILALMNIKQPNEMTGDNLIIAKK